MRRQLPYGPVNPALVPGWALRYGVSEQYVWAVALGLAHLHQDALPPDSPINMELDRRYRMSGRKRSVRRRTVHVKKDELADVAGDAQLACGYCGVSITLGEATKDHKVPVNMGGGNELENLHLVCRPCNRLKSDNTDAEFRLILDLARVHGERSEGLVLRVARRLALLETGGE